MVWRPPVGQPGAPLNPILGGRRLRPTLELNHLTMRWTRPGDGCTRAMTESWKRGRGADRAPTSSRMLLDGFLRRYAQLFLWIAGLWPRCGTARFGERCGGRN